MKYVVAENFQQFKNYYPKPQHDVAYLHDIQQIYGKRGYELDFVGTWWKRDRDFLNRVEQEFNLTRRKA